MPLINSELAKNDDWLFYMLEYLTFQDRSKLPVLNKSWSGLQRLPEWAHLQCVYASHEYKLFCPEKLPEGVSWEVYFQELCMLKDLWQGGELSRSNNDYSQRIEVFARFKPLSAETRLDNIVNDGPTSEEVVLPFHQRIAIMKASSPSLSTKDCILALQRRGDWFPGHNQEVPQEEDSALVDIGRQDFKFRIHTANDESGEVVMACPNIGLRDFQFNGILNEQVKQATVYDRVGRKLVVDCLNGFTGTLFAYGQTGAGKSFTMFGPDDLCATGYRNNSGLVPRICDEIFRSLKSRKREQKIDGQLSISYIEVFGDKVFDLLKGSGRQVSHSKVSAQRFVLKGEAREKVNSIDQVRSLLARGESQKSKASTEMNERSTRAHSLLVLSVIQRCIATGAEIESKLFLGDLGGSERLDKSKATGQQMVETVNINMGLLSLKKVISALNSRRRTHIPYKDSKLTMLLSEGLGGTSRTKIVVCASLDPRNASETLQTLRFGEECSLVKTKHGNNVNLVVSLVREIDEKIEKLEAVVKEKERWETIETRRTDALVEAGTFEEALGGLGGETIKTSRLVGAEREHRELHVLHEQRRKLLGQVEA